MRRAGASLLAAGLLCLAAAPSAETVGLAEKKVARLKSKGQFYDRHAGSIAFLPRVGSERYLDRAWTHDLLPDSGLYRLKRKGNYFFRVNIVASSEETSYLGVLVYLIYPGQISHRPPLNLTRNDAQWLAGPGRQLDPARRGPRSPETGLDEYFKAHAAETLAAADELLTFTWHAAVATGAPHSWDYRSRWAAAQPPLLREFLEELDLAEADVSMAVTAQMIQFTSSASPRKDLDFYFNADQASGAYMLVFSPLRPEFEKAFYLIFE